MMSFKNSLSAFQFLSELYAQDVPDAVLMTEYPSSNSKETRFQNRTKFIIHDPFPPPPVALLKTLGPHHLMYGWGQKIPVTSELAPPTALIDHWHGHFGDVGCPNWQPLRDDTPYITSFPFESLSVAQQVIDPTALYHLHSKHAIAEIPCSQAHVYDSPQFPCILKLSHGYAGMGNFFIRNSADLETAKTQINAQWPDAPIIINQLLSDIIGDFGVQFYLNTHGEMTWLGFTQQVFNESGKWSGGIFNADVQDEFYDAFMKIATPVAQYLHEKGYFGVVGIDILQNKTNEFFLVDLNPRLTGITPFLITSRLCIAEGYSHGLYAASVEISGCLEDTIKIAEAQTNARVLILSGYQAPHSETTLCHVSINGDTYQTCVDTLSRIRRHA